MAVKQAGPLGRDAPPSLPPWGPGAAILAKEPKLGASSRKTSTVVDPSRQKSASEEPLSHLGLTGKQKRTSLLSREDFPRRIQSTGLIVGTELKPMTLLLCLLASLHSL